MFDANEILDAAELKNNVFTRNLVKTVYYAACIVIYPFIVVKHFVKR